MPITLDQMMPSLLQAAREKRQEKRRETRRQEQTKRIAGLFQSLTGGQGRTLDAVAPEGRAKAFAELASYGVNLPQHYALPLQDITNVTWPDEIKDAYKARLISFSQAATMNPNRGDPTDDELEIMWKQSLKLQQAFPGSENVTGPQQMSTYMGLIRFGAAPAANRIFGFGPQGQPTVRDQNMRLVQKYFPEGRPEEHLTLDEYRTNPGIALELSAGGFTQKEVLGAFGYNPESIAKVESTILKRAKEESLVLGFDFTREFALWQAGERENPTLDKYYDVRTGQIKEELIFEQLDRQDELMKEYLGLTPAQGAEFEHSDPQVQKLLRALAEAGIRTRKEAEVLLQSARARTGTQFDQQQIYSDEIIEAVLEFLGPADAGN